MTPFVAVIAALLALLMPGTVAAQPAERRVALLIGNSDYSHERKLRNPVSDATLLGRVLKDELKFDVVRVERNLDANGMDRVIEDFARQAQGATTVVFYYSGHGLSAPSDRRSYLLPVDARTGTPDAPRIERQAVAADTVRDRLRSLGAKVTLLILDACRDGPGGGKSGSKGLARVGGGANLLIAYATDEGRVAEDGNGGNSPYAEALAKAWRQPQLTVLQQLDYVYDEVTQRVPGQQPMHEGNLRANVWLSSPFGVATPQVEDEAWARCQAATSRGPCDDYLGAWPGGRYAAQARMRVADLQAPAPGRVQPGTAAGGGNLVVRIGHVAPTSGSLAHIGKDNENGALLAIEELNGRGIEIGGRSARFELVASDDAADPKRAVAVAQDLVAKSVAAVVGHLNSSTSIPASTIYAAAGIPQITPSASNVKLTRQELPSVFRVIADDDKLGAALGGYAVKQLRATSIAVVDDETTYGRAIADAFIRGVQVANGSIVAREHVAEKSADYQHTVLALKPTSPDLVFYGGMDTGGGPLLRQMVRNGVRAKFMGGDGICSNQFPTLAAVALDKGDVYCAEHGGVEPDLLGAMQQFRSKYKQRFNQEVLVYAPYTYDAVMVLAVAMVRAGSAEPAKFLPELRLTQYQGTTGRISFNSRGDIVRGAVTLHSFEGTRRLSVGVIRADN